MVIFNAVHRRIVLTLYMSLYRRGRHFPIQNIANCTKDLLSAVCGCITAPKLVSLCYISFISDQFCVATKNIKTAYFNNRVGKVVSFEIMLKFRVIAC